MKILILFVWLLSSAVSPRITMNMVRSEVRLFNKRTHSVHLGTRFRHLSSRDIWPRCKPYCVPWECAPLIKKPVTLFMARPHRYFGTGEWDRTVYYSHDYKGAAWIPTFRDSKTRMQVRKALKRLAK